MDCLFCGNGLTPIAGDVLPRKAQLAFDPRLGRLWQVCPSCDRWNAVPFEDRWEILELCEQATRQSTVLLESDQLTLLQTGEQRFVRVGRPPRVEFSVWRYSELLEPFRRPRQGLRRLLRLPERPVGGAIGRDYHGGVVTVPPAWIGSAFIEDGGLLTLLFTSVPLAGLCPACSRPMMIEPAHFGDVRLERDGSGMIVVALCALCRTEVSVPIGLARPALRTGLAIVNRRHDAVDRVRLAVESIDKRGRADQFVRRLGSRGVTLGSLPARLRLALWFALDEIAELESLEVEWRRAEHLASIADGELTIVPGFEEFRRRVGDSHRGD